MAERRGAGSPSQSTLDQELARQAFHDSLNSYDQVVKELGIVQATLVGYKSELRTAFTWHVLSREFSPEEMAEDPRFTELDNAATQVRAEIYTHQPLRLANVLPSRLGHLQRLYEAAGFTLELIPFTDQEVETGTDGRASTEAGELDILIGGVETYHQRLQKTREIAQQARTGLGEGFEETFHLDMFDRMKDKTAGVMLKDITLARNAAIKGGFARALELQAEPFTVLAELTGYPYTNLNPGILDIITALDVTGAIEAGVLQPYF